MNFSTLKGIAFAAMLGMGAMTLTAQTFVYEGLIYKASGTKLTVQKPGTKLTTDQEAIVEYDGDYNIPLKLTYNSKEYTVNSIGNAFKGTKVKSVVIADGIGTISRGCFQGCHELTSVVLPGDLTTMNGDLFKGCWALQEIVIPGTVKEIASTQFTGCQSLKKITFLDGPTPLEISAAAFTADTVGPATTQVIEEIVLNRAIGDKFVAMDTKPFRGGKGLTKLTIGGSCKSLAASYFEGASNLAEVVFDTEEFTTLGTNVFAGTALVDFTLPESITSISASCFQGCKQLKKVTLGSGVTRIDDMAFYNSTLEEINLPEGLKTIGQMAFSGANILGDIVLPSTLTTLGVQAYANNKGMTSLSVPAATTRIGDGAVMGCTALAKFTVASDSEDYATTADQYALTSKDGATVVAYAPAAPADKFENQATALAPYALYKAANITAVNLPNCSNYGDYSLNGTSVSTLTLKGTIGRYVAANCPELIELTIDSNEAPFGVAKGDTKLENVLFVRDITTVKQDAFNGCSALENLDLGKLLCIIEADAFAGCGLKEITVASAHPAYMADGVFAADSGITAIVPVDYVDTYKAAEGWSLLDIKGNANLAVGGLKLSMPDGLYYAGTDGNLHCAYTEGDADSYDVGGVPHTFQLLQFNNRIYGASAGKKFIYSNTGSVDGDGKLFYISQVDGETFQAVLLDNAGGNAYKDPFGLYVYDDTLYVNDRNVCLRKIPASAIALPQNYPSWMENNWMAYYGGAWVYGCIKAGFSITKSENAKGQFEPLYWIGMKYNGNGIYRFKAENVGTSSGNVGAPSQYPDIMKSMAPIFTTFFIDEEHQHMYIYMEKCASVQDKWLGAGVYRINLSKIDENPDPAKFADLEPLLIDGAPVKFEGGGVTEHIGVSQFSIDENGEYLYWCHRAPSAEEAATTEAYTFEEMQGNGHYWWAEKFDAENPLHQSGIKRIKLGEANPTVEMVVPGVEGYGVVPVNFEGSKRPTGVKTVLPAAERALSFAAGQLTTAKDAKVAVYNAAGTMVAYTNLAAGSSLSTDNLAAGVYVVVADFANGGNQVIKITK